MKFTRNHDYRRKVVNKKAIMYKSVKTSSGVSANFYEQCDTKVGFVQDVFLSALPEVNMLDFDTKLVTDLEEFSLLPGIVHDLQVSRHSFALDDYVLDVGACLPHQVGTMKAIKQCDYSCAAACIQQLTKNVDGQRDGLFSLREVLGLNEYDDVPQFFQKLNGLPFFKDGRDPRFSDSEWERRGTDGYKVDITGRVAVDRNTLSPHVLHAARAELSASISDSKHHPPGFNQVERAFVPQWWDMLPTPLMDSVFHRQWQERLVAESVRGSCSRAVNDKVLVMMFTYALIGRLLHVASEDNWQFQLTLVGEGGTGKSLIAKVIKSFFPASEIGTIEHSSEKTFGLQGLVGKELLYLNEIRPGSSFSITDWLTMVEGATSSVRRKHNEPKNHSWRDCSMFAVGNCAFGDEDLGNSRSRRIALVGFKSRLRQNEVDPELWSKLERSGEVVRFLIKCNHAYLALRRHMNEYSVKSFLDIRPEYFRAQAKHLSQGSSPFDQFLMSEFVEYDQNARVSLRELGLAFLEYAKSQSSVGDTVRIPKHDIMQGCILNNTGQHHVSITAGERGKTYAIGLRVVSSHSHDATNVGQANGIILMQSSAPADAAHNSVVGASWTTASAAPFWNTTMNHTSPSSATVTAAAAGAADSSSSASSLAIYGGPARNRRRLNDMSTRTDCQ
jgi:hypothetical protein